MHDMIKRRGMKKKLYKRDTIEASTLFSFITGFNEVIELSCV